MSEHITLKPLLSLSEVKQSDWRELLLKLSEPSHPFIQYEFLQCLEETQSVSSDTGWQPCHLAFYKGKNLVALLPNYIKGHSYGEYVFDWAWAEAYHRHGLEYYPKALTAIPMTPATGPRLLSSLSDIESKALVGAVIEWLKNNELSSWHINFVQKEQSGYFNSKHLLTRSDIQFHWHNESSHGEPYTSFNDFLSSLKAKKRKNILRERKPFRDGEWSFCWLDGHSATADDWKVFDQMYRNTFDKKGGWAQLAPNFFEECARALPEQTLLLLAKHSGKVVAGAFFMRSDNTLYGRYWGAFEEVEFLHFETCYYQGIEYAIDNELQVFEPGAQGEHKLARGFLPVFTNSYHYVVNSGFNDAISHAIEQEQQWLDLRYQEYLKHSPYKVG